MKKQTYGNLYLKMIQIRMFEETAAWLFSQGRVHGTAHFCIGEEASYTGVCAALEKEDMITQTHRSHGQGIARGMDIKRMMAEFLGKETGFCKGKGGSMHIADFSAGSLGANGIVGSGISVAVGAALSQKYFKKPNITVSFFGDGASNEGAFHESLNLASIWRLPILFVCVNNYYGMSTHMSRSMQIDDISIRASSYGIRGIALDGNDVLAVYEETANARDYALENGPVLMVLNTYRWLGHSKSDVQVYRTKEEVDGWKEKCPIRSYREYLVNKNIFTRTELDDFDKQARNEIDAALAFAESSGELSVERIFDDVYASGDIREQKPKNGFTVDHA